MTSGSCNGAVSTPPVAACQRCVSELQGSLTLLADRCISLEKTHGGALDQLRAISSMSTSDKLAMSPEGVKRQVASKMMSLRDRHAELMGSVEQLLASSDAVKSSGQELKPEQKASDANAEEPAVDERSTRYSATEQRAPTDGTAAKVMAMEGPLAKMDSRLRFHDVQAPIAPDQQAPERSWLSAAPVTSGPAPAGRAFPGAEPVTDSRIFPAVKPTTQSGMSSQVSGGQDVNTASGSSAPKPDRVEFIRRRAAELGSRRAAEAHDQHSLTNSEPFLLHNASDFLNTSDAMGTAISDVWARFHPSKFGETAQTAAGPADSAGPAISDVWARFHPSRGGGGLRSLANGCGGDADTGRNCFASTGPLPTSMAQGPPQGSGSHPASSMALPPLPPTPASVNDARHMGACSFGSCAPVGWGSHYDGIPSPSLLRPLPSGPMG
eukprot:TRINITY_DN42742_c0_g1_i1.p1 TRINITY_DN42742_c0_g1~~TRINITY_DN42742_c0_g1_i1.p1  ORF type:complete len:438 (+),score=64.04 TRINITY_DN42742_c0_g1_i1:176-1489(+)